MPLIFLNPAAESATMGKEEAALTGRLADEMQPLLREHGILFSRRSRENETFGEMLRQANADYYDLHLALRVFFPPKGVGAPCAAYYPFSRAGRCAAETLAGFYRGVYPFAEDVRVTATVAEPELIRTNAPAAMFCCGTGRREGTDWTAENLSVIAKTLTDAICHLFNLDAQNSIRIRLAGRVNTACGGAGLYARPTVDAVRIAWLEEGEQVTVTGVLEGWYETEGPAARGFVQAQNILLG